MKKSIFLAWILICLTSSNLKANYDSGDTTIIQTIDYETPPLPWWNAPRAGTYKFPSADKTWSKILMYHKLKCDPKQNPKCGEWDYLTYSVLEEHTGILDSILYIQPSFTINHTEVDTFLAREPMSYNFEAYLEFQQIQLLNGWNEINTGEISSAYPLSSENKNTKSFFLYTKEELNDAGISAGEISGLRLNLIEKGATLKKLSIKIAETELAELNQASFPTETFKSVYSKETSFNNLGWQDFNFTSNYLWDGESNLIISFNFQKMYGTSQTMVKSEEIIDHALINEDLNYCGEFSHDLIQTPAELFQDVNDQITICFWAFGGPNNPKKSTFLMGVNDENQRKLNIHNPWENEYIYFDCGANEGEGGYDRVEYKGSSSSYKGKWTHWAFTKNSTTGIMAIYENGKKKVEATDKTKSIANISSLVLGSDLSGKRHFYEGKVNEFTLWNKALSIGEITNLMHNKPTADLPFYDNLKLYYSFDQMTDELIIDESPSLAHGKLIGKPQQLLIASDQKHKATPINTRPIISLTQEIIDPIELTQDVQIDTLLQDINMKIDYEYSETTNIPTDTTYSYKSYYTYSFDDQAQKADSVLIPADVTYIKEDIEYYGEPFEVINNWEIGRYITPYGNGLNLKTGYTWVYDVTDFAHLLHDSVHLRAGNFQELLDLKFIMIEGTPARDVKKITPLWNGNFLLKEFEEKVPAKTIALDPESKNYRIKLTTTGHGFGAGNNCAEFCHNDHSILINGEEKFKWDIIQECADNHLYPQGGTWIYDRAGWCPGLEGNTRNFEVSEFISGEEVELDYNCEYDPHGNYVVQSYLVEYGEYNFNYDMAINEILSPTNVTRFDRFNPNCGSPQIIIKNEGKETITSAKIIYGVEGGNEKTFEWTGELISMDSELVFLPTIQDSDYQISNTFQVRIESPNGQEDENSVNNHYKSTFQTTVRFPKTFIIQFKSNLLPNQNEYRILNSANEIVFEKTEFKFNQLHFDTLTLENDCYQFICTDSQDDGLDFWANPSQGKGYIRILDMEGKLLHRPNSDFGKLTTLNFTSGEGVGITEIEKDNPFSISPNPAVNELNIHFETLISDNFTYEIYNTLGQVIHFGNTFSEKNKKINISNIPLGTYVLLLRDQEGIEYREKFVKQ